ncbi:RICIN domain-containing protein [Arabiibacter massiliensis]|uniref:RICIN domain-containing protein n=1 Tax=Arabiibacter massiliensis TaxID=1870985 RepID=UPI0009BBAEDA|nr:RICIN domain-containing protein [Arabiibacter massiliensis]
MSAYPGNNFGYDSGWGYSSDDKVWLSVRCDATVGRMTELYLEMSVKSYYANGGVWSPTWFTDYPDTHVWTYIMDGMSGDRLSSKRGFYDTTYDSSSYHGPYVTDVHRIERRAYDWTAYAVVNAWCDSPDHANGIDITAEAGQIVPAHALVDDASWHGKIVTMRPEAAPHLYMDVAGGGVESGSNVFGWRLSDFTNQHWIALESDYGHTRFVPVHIGDVYRQLDIKGGDWFDDDTAQIYDGNTTKAQSFYVHDLGTGYHLIVAECSGCALDLNGGGPDNGTDISQWNCFDDWDNPNQHWLIEEPVFKTRDGGPLRLEASGAIEPGAVVGVAEDPNAACVPYNYPGTDGMFYKYEFLRFPSDPGPDFAQWEGGDVVRAASTDNSYQVGEADAGAFIVCVVTAWTRWTANVKYRGQAVTGALEVLLPMVDVRFFADGDAEPCFEATVRRGEAFSVPQEAWDAAAKPECAGVEGWFVDAACSVRFADGSVVSEPLDLFAFNRVKLVYAQAETSCLLKEGRECYLDENLTEPAGEGDVLPPKRELRHGDLAVFDRGAPVWFEERGRVREAACEQGAYADAAAHGVAQRTARLTCNTTAYLRWRTPSYDGIAVS